MKKILLFLLLTALSLPLLSGCGGNTSAPANVPAGENPGIPSVVQLTPDQYIAQTNGHITLHTKVLDGNGIAVPNQTVTYTNLSALGTLSSTTAITDSLGIATVTLSSPAAGFVTVLAQIYSGASQVRDQKVVYFTSNDVLAVMMLLDADANNNGIYDEPSDILLGETPSDTSVKIRARVYDAGGVLLAGEKVTFSAERPYRVGTSILGTDATTACSDGSSTCWIAFPLGTSMYTNTNGEAFAQVIVGVESLRNFTSNLNIFATAGNGASNMKTLFISPVTVSSITVTAKPPAIPPSTPPSVTSTSTITATALTNFNQPVPDGTAINFSIDSACATAGGKITPFGRTTSGSATATFTAPTATLTCTITASIGSVSATTTVLVTTPLSVLPSTMTLNETQTGTFTVYGGVAPYTIFSDNPSNITITGSPVAVSGGTFTVKPLATFCTPIAPATTCTGTATITVRDNVGTTVTATITVNGT